MSIVLVGSTSGSVTLQEPAVAGTTVLDLPATSGNVVVDSATQTLTNKSIAATQLTGTIAAARLPTGSVLQVVSTTKTDTFSTTSTSFVDITSLSTTITPANASNKVLVTVTLIMGQSDVTGLTVFNLVRGSTNISQPATTPSFNGTAGAFTSASDNLMPVSFSFLDSPATTSATTYKVQGRINTGALLINRRNTADCNFTSTITVMEIAG